MTTSVLGEIGERRFLREYWQRKPLLIRRALPGFQSPLTPDELAGLALEEEVESRLVLERGRKGPWELRNGPFTAEDFAKLPKTRWSLPCCQPMWPCWCPRCMRCARTSISCPRGASTT